MTMEGVVKFDQIFIFLCWNDSKGERGGERVGYMVLKRHFQQYLSYIVAVSFIGGGNRSTQRKSSTCRKSLTNFIA
jgi:hypothetical protein